MFATRFREMGGRNGWKDREGHMELISQSAVVRLTETPLTPNVIITSGRLCTGVSNECACPMHDVHLRFSIDAMLDAGILAQNVSLVFVALLT